MYITNLPQPEPADTDALITEVDFLRSKFLMWSVPLVGEGMSVEDGPVPGRRRCCAHVTGSSRTRTEGGKPIGSGDKPFATSR